MGEATGAAAIFGVTGGVMEAALRSVSEILTGEELEKIEFKEIRGEQGIKKRASLKLGERDIKVVVAHGLGNAQTIMEEIKSGKSRLSICRNNGLSRRLHYGRGTTY